MGRQQPTHASIDMPREHKNTKNESHIKLPISKNSGNPARLEAKVGNGDVPNVHRWEGCLWDTWSK